MAFGVFPIDGTLHAKSTEAVFNYELTMRSMIVSKRILIAVIFAVLNLNSIVKADPSPQKPQTSSERSDYVGDCFRINTTLKINDSKGGKTLKPGEEYFVTKQDDTNVENPELSLVTGRKWSETEFINRYIQATIPGIGCAPAESTEPGFMIDAGSLTESGATRRGYSYGFLTMPYKYYPSKKSFTADVPIGGYLGWRIGQPGSGLTFAAASTIGTVAVDTVDPKTASSNTPTVTGSTNASAISFAFGLIFDISKNPSKKAFKSGIFVGKDFVNSSPSINFTYNNEMWVAIQIGYDITDK